MSESGTDEAERYADETWRALDSIWNGWGRLDPALASPRYQSRFIPTEIWQHMGVQEPEPPSVEHPSFAVVRRQYGALLTSYGLSFPDTWGDAAPVSGVGVEVYGAAAGMPADWPAAQMISDSWLGQMVWSVAQTVSKHGMRFIENLEHFGTLSMTLSGLGFPDEARGTYVDDQGDACVLLGLTDASVPATVDGPLGPIRLVNVKLLTTAETHFCVSGGRSGTGVTDARGELAQRFADQGDALWSSITRQSVV
ncbi:hypothetical protein [Nocardia sp. IFM 10818]